MKEILLELEDIGRKITLKDEQRKAVKQLYGKKDLLAVLPTGSGKSLIFQLQLLLENRNRKGHTASVLVICPLTVIINDQIFELESGTIENSHDYAKPNVAKFNSSILIQFNIYLFNSVRICLFNSMSAFI